MAGRGLGMTMPAWMKSAPNEAGAPIGSSGLAGSAAPSLPTQSAYPQQYADAQQPYPQQANVQSYGYPTGQEHRHDIVRQDRRRSRSREPEPGPSKRRSRFDKDDAPPVPAVASAAHVSGYGAPQFAGGIPGAPALSSMAAPAQGLPSSLPVNIKAMLSSALANVAAGASMAGGGTGMMASRPYRRLYVGSVPTCTEQELQAFINGVLARAYMPGEHCIGVHVGGTDKKYAFLEFRTVDLATACLQLDGLMFKGQTLKVRRPNDYSPAGQPPPTGPPINLQLSAFGIISSNVPDGPNKIFIGGLPHSLTEEQLRELLGAFGQLKGLHLVKDAGAANNKGYAFAEFVDPSLTDVACGALHGLTLGDKALTVRRAGAQGAGAASAVVGGVPAGLNPAAMGLGGAAAAPRPVNLGVASHLPARAPTKLLRLQSMISAADLALPPGEWADLLEDITGELARHGAILRAHVPRAGPYAGNVYVLYADKSSSEVAARSVAGKTFDGRLVPVEYEDEGRMDEIQQLG